MYTRTEKVIVAAIIVVGLAAIATEVFWALVALHFVEKFW